VFNLPRKARKHVKKVSKTDEALIEVDADVKKPKTVNKEDEFSKCLAEFNKYDIGIVPDYLKSYIKDKGIESASVLLNNTKKLRNI
jgi:hypothetical protein